MRRASAIALTIALLAFAFTRDALADDVAKARKIFADGVHLYQVGDYEGAARLFREANTEHHAPAIVYNIGLAEEKLGHRQAAIDAYESYVAETGEKGEFSSAAVSAIAQIRTRSTKLRVETKPAGARVFVDGAALTDPAPATVLVGAGHHVVIVQGEGWRAEKDLDAKGGGDSLTVTLEEPAAPPATHEPVEPPRSLPAIDVVPPSPPPPPPPPPRKAEARAEPDGLVWGAAFAFVPAWMIGVTTPGAGNRKSAETIVAGPVVEVGYALTESFEFLGRAFAGLGPDGKPSYAYWGGPGLSYHLLDRLWIGATFIGGQLESKAGSPKVRYGTDVVFGTMLEASIVILKKPEGEWSAGIQPTFLLTEMRNDNTTFFFPVTFGYRAF